MDILDLIKKRVSVRNYKDKPIPENVLDKILEAGIWGPSLVRYQPWRIISVTNKDVKIKIADILLNKSNKLHIGYNTSLKTTQRCIREAPCVLVVHTTRTVENMMKKFGKLYKKCGEISEISATSAAIQNILLMIETTGLSSNWFAMPIFCEKSLSKLLDIDGQIVGLVTIGFSSRGGSRSKRKAYNKFIKKI